MKSRAIAAADALGSTRAAGLEPSKEALAVIDQWVRGELSDIGLDAAAQRFVEANTVHRH